MLGVVKVALRRWIESDGDEPLLAVLTDSLARIGDAFDQFHHRQGSHPLPPSVRS